MGKMFDKIKSLLPSRRKIIQLYFALLYNANLKGFANGNVYRVETKNFCVPGINCYSCPGAVAACPLGSLQGAFSSGKSTVYYMGGILLLFGVLFGRLICGYACPFGLFQELFYKIKTPKIKKNVITRILSYLKYLILVVFVFVIPIIYAFREVPLPAFCKYICPAGTIEGGVSLLANKVNDSYFSMLGPIFTWKFVLLISFIVGTVFVFRLFCRFFCPLGALYGLFNRFSLFGIKLDMSKCTHCDLCVRSCKMDVKRVGDHECISCGECISVCPTNAISWKGSVFKLPPNDIPKTEANTVQPAPASKKRRIIQTVSAVLMVAVLVFAVVCYWNDPANDVQELPVESNGQDVAPDAPPLGNTVGSTCYSYPLERIDTEGLTGETVDPVGFGKVTVINFWGTWCTPCVAELPHFDSIAEEYDDKVAVLAIHTHLVYETAFDYIKNNYPQSKIIFAKDWDNSDRADYHGILGGRDAYPYTVIIDAEGVITDVFMTSVTHSELKAAVEKAIS